MSTKAPQLDPEEPPPGVKAAIESMHELGDTYPTWVESQLTFWKKRAAGLEEHKKEWRKHFAGINPSADKVLPPGYNPMLHVSMPEAAGLNAQVVHAAVNGFRVRGNMPHTDCYDYVPGPGNKAQDITEE